MNRSKMARRSKARMDARRLEEAWLNGPRITVMMPIFRVRPAKRYWWRIYIVNRGEVFHFGSQGEAENVRVAESRASGTKAWKEALIGLVMRASNTLFRDYVRSMLRNEAITPAARPRVTSIFAQATQRRRTA